MIQSKPPLLVAVVEDDAPSRTALGRLLLAAGFDPVLFESAEAYLDASPAPTCLVVDVKLPGMSGIELRHSLAGANSTTPVVFITAHDDDRTRDEALAAGCVAYLRKPFDTAQLFAALERGRGSRE